MRLKCAVRLGPSLKYLGFSVLPGFEREREIDVERIRTLGFSSFFFFFLSKELEASLERGWKSGGNFFKMARKMMVFDQSRKVHAFSRIFHSPVALFPDVPPPVAEHRCSEISRSGEEEGGEEDLTAAWKWYSQQAEGRNNFQRFREIPRNIKFRIFIYPVKLKVKLLHCI